MRSAVLATMAAIVLAIASACSRSKPETAAANSNGPPEITIPIASQRAADIKVAPASQHSVPLSLRAVGNVTINEQETDHIGVVFPGIVTQIFASVGDRVRAGQVLATMHSHDLHDAIASYQSAMAEAGYARTVRDRYKKLYELQYASREESDHSELQYEKAFANLTAARAHLAGMLQVPERGLEKLDIDADRMPIKAPHKGIVISRGVTPGMALQPGSETFTISDLSSLWMIASVSESDVHAVRLGQAVAVKVGAFPNTSFLGHVDLIGPRLDPATRTLSVRVLMPNVDGRLRPNMFGTAEIEEGGSRAAIFVPEVSVQDMNGNTVVFVQHGSETFEARPVQTGTHHDGLVELQRGVRSGEDVVTDGAFVVKSQFLTRALSQD